MTEQAVNDNPQQQRVDAPSSPLPQPEGQPRMVNLLEDLFKRQEQVAPVLRELDALMKRAQQLGASDEQARRAVCTWMLDLAWTQLTRGTGFVGQQMLVFTMQPALPDLPDELQGNEEVTVLGTKMQEVKA